MSSRTGEEDAELSAALGWPGGISEPLLDRVALLRLVAAAAVELASMRRCFEAADRERSELRDRAERAEAERDALRAEAERYRWLRIDRDWGFWCCHEKDGEGGQILKYGADLDAAIDAALEKDKSVTAPPIWETLAEIGESAPAGTWDALPAELGPTRR